MLCSSFSRGLRKLVNNLSASQYSHCDDEENTPSLVEQADAAIENEKGKIKTPMHFENLRGTLMQGSPNTFDGFRLVVQKQVNLNTVVSHFYWLGSQSTPAPIYQYRIILPSDDRVINVATDADFNIEGEVKTTISPTISAKSNFVIGGEQSGKSFSVDLDVVDGSAATQLQYSTAGGSTVGLSYMQALTPSLTLGGVGQYTLKKKILQTGFGGIYDYKEHLFAAQYAMDSNFRMLYLRRVNSNRVQLSTDLHVNEELKSTMSIGAEYTMKQSKLHMSIDSDMLLKSSLESTVAPGVTMQFAAEMLQAKDHYKFGCGIVMG